MHLGVTEEPIALAQLVGRQAGGLAERGSHPVTGLTLGQPPLGSLGLGEGRHTETGEGEQNSASMHEKSPCVRRGVWHSDRRR